MCYGHEASIRREEDLIEDPDEYEASIRTDPCFIGDPEDSRNHSSALPLYLCLGGMILLWLLNWIE